MLIKSKGFTLVEALIVIGVAAIVLAVGWLNLFKYRIHQDLASEIKSLVAVLRDAQQRAITGEDGNQWGVYLEAPINDRDFYKLFKGFNYEKGTSIAAFYLKTGNQFLDPAQGRSKELVFSKMSGRLDAENIIKIEIGLASDPSIFNTVTISNLGKIEY